MRYLARREAGQPLRVYQVDAERGLAHEAGFFSPQVGLAAAIPGGPSSLCSPGTYAIADSTAEALKALYDIEDTIL